MVWCELFVKIFAINKGKDDDIFRHTRESWYLKSNLGLDSRFHGNDGKTGNDSVNRNDDAKISIARKT